MGSAIFTTGIMPYPRSIDTKTGIRPEEVSLREQHVLFVEGESMGAFDINILKELFPDGLNIKPLGNSENIKSVAKSLFPHNPTYYFLIDRDYYSDDFVDECWKNFPDPSKHNLLIWKKHELENYFLDTHYLAQTQYCNVSEDELEAKIIEAASPRIYCDAANYVVASIRYNQYNTTAPFFQYSEDFADYDQAICKIKELKLCPRCNKAMGHKLTEEYFLEQFVKQVETMNGGNQGLMSHVGTWRDMVSGKEVLKSVINSSCFKVRDRRKKFLQGDKKIQEVLKNLLRKEITDQPQDFQELRKLIENRGV